jgi:hypothetical protein
MSTSQHPPITTALEAELDAALHETLDEVDALKAENAQLKAQVDGLLEGFEKGGSLGILQAIGADRSWPVDVRVRALTAAVPFERPRLSMTATVQHRPLFDILEEAHQRRRKVIEAPPAEPANVLNEGQGHAGGWHPLDDQKGDPAA